MNKFARGNDTVALDKQMQAIFVWIIHLITPWRQRTLKKIFEILSWFFNGVVHRWHINIPSRWRLRGSPLFRIRNTCTHADEHHYKVPSYPTVQEHESISSRDSHGTGGPTRVRCPSIGLCIIIVQCNMWFHWMEWGGAYKGVDFVVSDPGD